MQKLGLLIALSIVSFFVPAYFGDAWFVPIILILLALGVVFSFGTLAGLFVYMFVAVIGTSFDILVGMEGMSQVMGNLGSRTFTHETFFGVPSWVPFMYGNTCLVVLHIYQLLNTKLRNRSLRA
mgnify:CR=1 FL=1